MVKIRKMRRQAGLAVMMAAAAASLPEAASAQTQFGRNRPTASAPLPLPPAPVAATAARTGTQISFEAPGAEPWVLDELRAASLLASAETDEISDPQELMAAARSDYARLLGVLYAQAHYSAVINILVDGREAATIPPLDAPARIGAIRVVIQPGPVFDFRQTRIAPLAHDTSLPEGFQPNRRAHSTLIQESVDAARLGWRNVGHAKVGVADQSVVADHTAERLDVDVVMAPGPQVTFGTLIIKGNKDVRTQRIDTIAGLPTGEVYSPDEMRDAARRLRRSGAFSSVALEEGELLPGNRMDVTATVIEQLPRRFGFGAEYNTSEGLTLSGYWMHRNLLGGAENLRFDAEVTGIGSEYVDLGDSAGGQNYRFSVTYTRPATISPDTDLSVLLLAEKKDEEYYTTENLIFNVGVIHYFSDTLTGRLGFEFGNYRVTDYGGPERDFQILSLPAGLTWDRRNDPLNATSGFYLDGLVQPFYGAASTGGGGRATLDARAYWTPGESGRFTLAGRTQVGAVLGPSVTDMPPDYLFFSGGGGTVRGQPFESLGVKNPDYPDSITGGRAFLGLSGEVRSRFTETIQGVAFYDAGYVGGDSFFDDSGSWQAGAGIGVRYNTGIGPIRLDIAAPVQGDTGDGIQIYVGIGQAF